MRMQCIPLHVTIKMGRLDTRKIMTNHWNFAIGQENLGMLEQITTLASVIIEVKE